MNFQINDAVDILERTPKVLAVLLSGLSNQWLEAGEGEGTWNPIQVVDHLIEAEKTNWIPRLESMLQEGERNPLPPFDRYAHLNRLEEATIEQSLLEFEKLRLDNIMKLKELVHTESQFQFTGIHPEFGTVKVSQMLSTWVVHDLTHISQILRVMAKRYRDDVGPWVEYLGILKERN